MRTILYQCGDHFIQREPWGFGIYRCGVTHSTLIGRIGDGPNHGLKRAIAVCDNLETKRIAAPVVLE